MKKIITFSITLLTFFSIAQAQNSSPYWSLSGNNNETGTSKFGTTNKFSLHFYTNNVQRMYIDSSNGRVGIGTITPQDKLHVNSASGENAFRAQVNGTTKLLVASNGGVSIGQNINPPGNGLFVQGKTGINTSTPAYNLDVNGGAGIRNGLVVLDSGATITNTKGADGLIVTSTESGSNGIFSKGDEYGVFGSGTSAGIYGSGSSGTEGVGTGYYGTGIYGAGYGTNGSGGYFYSPSYDGVVGTIGSSGQYAGYFQGNVYSTGSYQGSDAKLKKNIAAVDNAMNIINKLAPRYYEFRTDGNYAKMNLPQGKHYGLIAQDVEAVLPGLVKETEFDVTRFDEAQARSLQKPGEKPATPASSFQQNTKHEMVSFKALNYTELIPVLVKALQEVNAQKEAQDAKIADLENKINNLTSIVSKLAGSNTTALSFGFLKQNIPNPAGSNTIIGYVLPQNTVNGKIVITDAKGSLLKTFTAAAGENQLSLSNGDLPAGIYNYSLYANNKVVDTKQMVIAK